MQTLIDALTSFTGWTFSHPSKVSAHVVNEYSEYIAGNTNDASLIFKFSDANGEYAEKVFSTPIDVISYNEVVISVLSRAFAGAGIDYKKPADFMYKIDFGSGKEFYLPVPFSFSDITFFLNGITSIERIRITAVHSDTDYLFVSNCVAVKDELPLDILRSVQEKMESEITEDLGDGIAVGTVASASAGDDSITIGGDRFYCESYALLLIKDGSNQEYIQVGDNDGSTYKLMHTVNNGVLTNSYTGATVYLQIKVRFGISQDDIILPSICLWGFTPEPIFRGSKIQSIFDTYKTDGSLTERRDAQIQLYRIFFQCESRNYELNGIMGQYVRDFLAREFVYMNGRKFEIKGTVAATEQEPADGVNDVFRHTYEGSIEVKEDIGKRSVLPNTSTINTSLILSRS